MTKKLTKWLALVLVAVLSLTSIIMSAIALKQSRQVFQYGGSQIDGGEDSVLTADKTQPQLYGAIESKDRQSRNTVEVDHDEEQKTMRVTGGRYAFTLTYDDQFNIDTLNVDGKELFAEGDGIYTSLKAADGVHTSKELNSAPSVRVDGTDKKQVIEVTYNDGVADYAVTITAVPESFTLDISRTFQSPQTLSAQAFPAMQFEQDAIENIRWLESGSNFWVDGEGNDLKNFLSAEKFDPTLNIKRAMDEINFVLLSSFEDDVALRVSGTSSNDNIAPETGREHNRGRATEVDRAPEANGKRSLLMNVVMARPGENLRYSTGDPVWGWNTGGGQKTGSIQPTGAETVFSDVEMQSNDVTSISLTFTPDNFEDHFDLGELYGINEKLVSEAVNSFARIMLLGKNVGTAQEFPNVYIELPALQMHWNTALASIFGDAQSMNTQEWALRNIHTFLQKESGHIRSPYPGIEGDGWGRNYPSMQTNYVTAIVDFYGYTGDVEFAMDMREAAEKSLQYFEAAYYDKEAKLVKNPIPLNPNDDKNLPYLYESHNDYWEKSVGTYNALLTVEYYEALIKLAQLEEVVYKDQNKAAAYRNTAEEIREVFNKDKAEGGCFVPEQNAFYYGSSNMNVSYLPVQATAVRTGIVSAERAVQLGKQIERIQSNFNMGFHVMNVRDLKDDTKPASQGSAMPTDMMVGENGGWYGAPDAEWYSVFPKLGDRGLIPYYINESMKKFEQTGFTGATTYKRDGVTPADDGWWECMPNMALPIWGLYTYGYGFQSSVDGLTIAPFIDESMVGSKVNYYWRGTDFTVTYNGLFEYRIEYAKDVPVQVCFLNQTPGKNYTVAVGDKEQTVTADSEGNVYVSVTAGNTLVKLNNPDSEEKIVYSGENAFAFNAVRPSSTQLDSIMTKFWAEQLTDGVFYDEDSGYWSPAGTDKQPVLTVVCGTRYLLKQISLYTGKGNYSFVLEGSDDLSSGWKTVKKVENAVPSKDGQANRIDVKINASFRYYRICFTNMNASDIQIYEITANG